MTHFQIRRRDFFRLAGAASLASLVRSSAIPTLAQPRISRSVLPNGIVLRVEQRPTSEIVAVQLLARAGSRDDADHPGITVGTSRMMFQGTERRPSESALQREVGAVGGTLERGTTTELSFFSCVVPIDEVDLAFDLLSDITGDPLLDEAILRRYQTITRQEILERESNPSLLVEDLFTASVLQGHPASGRIVGTTESLAAFTTDLVQATYERLWGAHNLVLSVVGGIDPDRALELASEYFVDQPFGQANDRGRSQPVARQEPAFVRGTAGQAQVQVRIGFVTPGAGTPDQFAFNVLNAVMSGSSGRLFREVRGEQGLAYSAGSAYRALTDTGLWFAAAGVDPENVDPVLTVMRQEIQRLADEAIPQDDIELVKSQLSGTQVLTDETNEARANRIGSQETLGTPSTEELLAGIRTVTPDDLQRVARQFLQASRAITVVVGPSRSA